MAIHALSTGAPTCAPSARSNSRTHDDTSILAAFKRFQDAHAALQLVADDKPEPPQTMTPKQERLWNEIDWAGDEVGRTPASTPEGIVAKLWLASFHSTTIPNVWDAAARADFKWFDEQGDNIEWQTRLIVEAIRSLIVLADVGGEA